MSQATIALLIMLFLGGSVALWNSNRHDHHGGHSGYHQGGGHGGGNGGGSIISPDPQQCS